jgi:hypothetical protein
MPEGLPKVLSTYDLARRYDVPVLTVIRVVDRLRLAARIGRNRVIMSEDVPRIEDALRGGGFFYRRARRK